MGKSSNKRIAKGRMKEDPRRFKKKTSILDSEGIDYVDWKDTELLKRFMSDRAKIRARRVNGNSEQQQREVSTAIKNAREMALLPYSSRVTTQRGGRGDRRGRRDRPPRDDDRRDDGEGRPPRPPRDGDERGSTSAESESQAGSVEEVTS